MNRFFKSVFVLVFFSLNVFGQIEKGNKYIWGSLNIPDNVFNSESEINTFKPSVQYTHFLRDGIAIQGNLKMEKSRYNFSTISGSKYNIEAGLSLRKYFKLKTNLFPYSGLGVTGIRNTTSSGNSKQGNEGYQFFITPKFEVGIMAILSSRISISANINARLFPISNTTVDIALNYSLRRLSFKDSTTIEQTQAKNWIIGGGISTDKTNTFNYIESPLVRNSYSETKFIKEFNLNYGKFIKTGLLLGVRTGISWVEYQYEESNFQNTQSIFSYYERTTNVKQYSVSPYLKKYYGKNRFALFTSFYVDFEYKKTKSEAAYQGNYNNAQLMNNDYLTYGMTASYGLAYFLGKHIVIEADLGRFSISKTKDQPRFMSLSLLNPSPQFTLNYVFLKK